jgi:hypothetical protein
MVPRFGIRFCNVEKWFPDLEFDFATLKNGSPIWDELFNVFELFPKREFVASAFPGNFPNGNRLRLGIKIKK